MSGKAIRETLTGLGVIASMVFVGMEIRQNTAATQTATAQAIFDSSDALMVAIMSDARLRELLVLGREDPGSLDDLSPPDFLLLQQYHLLQFTHMQEAFVHHSEGALTDAVWHLLDTWISQTVPNSPMDRYFWQALSGPSWGGGFSVYVDSLLDDTPQN